MNLLLFHASLLRFACTELLLTFANSVLVEQSLRRICKFAQRLVRDYENLIRVSRRTAAFVRGNKDPPLIKMQASSEACRKNMGSSMSVLWTSQDDNTVDSTTGLTPKQKKIVQSTWNVARKDPVGSGVTVMIMFFKKHPDYQQFFSTFKDIPMDQLPDNKRFQAHCAYIITTLNSVIDSMHDFGLLEATLLSLGERHKNRGQTQQQFQHLREILVEFLSQRLGTDFTPEVADAWIKTLDLVYAGIFKAYA